MAKKKRIPGRGGNLEETRRVFLEKALSLFNKYGTQAISTNRIAIAAHSTPGTLYYHFRNKEEIILALFLELNAHMAQQFQNLPQAPLSAIAQILNLSFAIFEDYAFISREFPQLVQNDLQFRNVSLEMSDHRLTLFNQIFKNLKQDAHFLKDQVTDCEIENAIEIAWIVGFYWLPHTESTTTKGQKQDPLRGFELILQVLKPLFNDTGLSQLLKEMQRQQVLLNKPD